MIYANDIDGNRIVASKEIIGYCPICLEKLTAKCGPKKIDHWSHKTNSLCEYRKDNDMCDWHIEWQNNFNINQREVRYKNLKDNYKIADVMVSDLCTANLIIEFQHSPITKDEVENREESSIVFGNNSLIWIFDKIDVYKSRRLWYKKDTWYSNYTWKHEHLDYKYCGKSCDEPNVFLDVGGDKIMYIIDNILKRCIILDKDELITALKQTNWRDDPSYQYIWKYLDNKIHKLKQSWCPRINDFKLPNGLYNLLKNNEEE